MRRSRGFSLTELLIAFAVLGILTAIALPSYRGYVERTNRTVAKTALSEIASRQESYATDHKGYASSLAALGYNSSGSTYLNSQGSISASSSGALYTLSLTALPSSGGLGTCAALSGTPSTRAYAIRAVPYASRIDQTCGTLCVGSNGDRGATGGADSCWQR